MTILLKPLFTRCALAVLTVLGVICEIAAAESKTPPRASNRWLLVVETTKSMHNRAEGTHQVAGALIVSGMNGQMQAGDTVGVWTYNDALHAGDFPLQRWTPTGARAIASKVYEYLQLQKHENRDRFERVLPALNEIIRQSEFITVVLISDGQETIKGTPFDQELNASYSQWRRQQEKAQLPFVTVLRAKNGTITDAIVNTPQFPMQMPPLPPELTPPPPEPARPQNAAGTQSPQVAAPTAQPLIIIGKKPEPQPAPPPVVEPSPEQPASSDRVVTMSTPPNPAPEISAPDSAIHAAPAQQPSTESTPAVQPAVTENTTSASDVTPTPNPGVDTPEIAQTEFSAPSALAQAGGFTPRPFITRTVWVAVIVVTLTGLMLLILLVRRTRGKAHASLITRSLDREQP